VKSVVKVSAEDSCFISPSKVQQDTNEPNFSDSLPLISKWNRPIPLSIDTDKFRQADEDLFTETFSKSGVKIIKHLNNFSSHDHPDENFFKYLTL